MKSELLTWKFLGVFALLLAASNFASQAMMAQDWARALDRSYFQLVALLSLWITSEITEK